VRVSLIGAIVRRRTASTVKRGIRPHSAAFSLSPFDGEATSIAYL
jgi:hypothetical protein